MMIKKNWKKFIVSKFEFNDEIRFRLSTCAKLSSIPLIAIITLLSLLWLILSINYIFFEVSKLTEVQGLKGEYFGYLIRSTMELIPFFIVFAAIVLISGIYIGNLFIRPFKQIGNYCRDRVKGGAAFYDIDFFSDLNLLTTFSEYFFNAMENSLKRGKLEESMIMQKYKKIHAPVFERNFYIHLFLVITVIMLISGMGIYFICTETYMDLIKLSVGNINMNKDMLYFFDRQYDIFLIVVWIVIGIQSFVYVALSIRLHDYVSVPSFAIFATMRSFLSGRLDSRVHIIGFKYAREPFRNFNKYLDYIQSECKKK